MTTKKSNADKSAAKPQPVADQEAPGLELKDLTIALQLIEAGIQRGIFQPKELVIVGETHGRIAAFLEHQAKLQAAAQKEKTSTQGDA